MSRVSWSIFGVAFLALPLLAALDDVGPRLNPEISDGTSIAGAVTLVLGFTLSLLTPWFSPKPVGERLILSLGTGFCWFLILGLFLSFYNEWHSRRRRAPEIELAFNERLLPAASFIRIFVEREHRLPSDDEMEAAGWQIGSIGGGRDDGITVYRERPNFWDTWGVPGRDFLLFTDVPDWNLYYSSWDHKRTEANWP